MGLRYFHLDESDVRTAMLTHWSSEWAKVVDLPNRDECFGKALTEDGWTMFGKVMPEALATQDDDWLYQQMDAESFWQERLPQRARGGTGWTTYAVNRPEHLRRLCFDEFNIAYIRGLAHALLDRGEKDALIYRAGEASEPRAKCSSWEDTTVPLKQVIGGHRAHYWPPPGEPSAWSLPTGVNCHHSIMAITRH
jgi:hypothetical protein